MTGKREDVPGNSSQSQRGFNTGADCGHGHLESVAIVPLLFIWSPAVCTGLAAEDVASLSNGGRQRPPPKEQPPCECSPCFPSEALQAELGCLHRLSSLGMASIHSGNAESPGPALGAGLGSETPGKPYILALDFLPSAVVIMISEVPFSLNTLQFYDS